MKKILIPALVIAIAVVLVLSMFAYFSAESATEIYLRYEYSDKSIYVRLEDEETISEIKGLLHGIAYRDSPSCGFSEEVSIVFTTNGKEKVLCIACDGCPLFRINDSNKYLKISEKSRQRLDEILDIYGITFPCI